LLGSPPHRGALNCCRDVGEDEILLDDSHRITERIDAAGGLAQLHIWEGMTHVFPFNLALQAAKEALDSTGRFLQQNLDH